MPKPPDRVLITTPRTQLRPIEDAHAPWLLAMLLPHRAELTPRLWWAPLLKSESDALWLCAHWRACWDTGEQFAFGVHDHEGHFIGVATLLRHHTRDLASGGAELAVQFDPLVVGRGLATEATRALLRWGYKILALHRVHSVAPLERGELSRFLLRLGFTPEGLHREAEWVGGRFWSVASFALLDRDALLALQEPMRPSTAPPAPLPSSIAPPPESQALTGDEG